MALTKISGGVIQQPIDVGIITASSGDFSGILTASLISATTATFSSNVNISGVVTANSFIGDGSGLTGVTASGSGINIKDSGATVGVAATVDFGTNLNVSQASAGIVTVTVGDDNFEIVDKIVHTGNTTTAIRFPADNTVSVETDGSEALRIDSTGNVGIGTTNPQRLLHLYSDSNNPLLIESPDQFADIVQADTSGSTRLRSDQGGFRFYTGGDASSVQALNATERLSITSSGDVNVASGSSVGIGTDNPRTKLDVDGGLIVKVSGTQPAWVSNAITGQEKFSIWQGASFNNACFNLDVDNNQTFLNHNVYYYSGWKQRLGGYTPIMIQLSSSNGVVFQKSSDNGSGTNDATTTLTELCRINTSGNLAFPSGNGIDFSAASGSAAGSTSALLDDYEEGTWSPTFSGATSTGGTARYTKIGRQVFVVISANITAVTGNIAISGLPFSAGNRSSMVTATVPPGSVTYVPVFVSVSVLYVDVTGTYSGGAISSYFAAIYEV